MRFAESTAGKIYDKNDDQIVEEQWQRYVRARDNGHTDYIARAKKCNDFYRGDQWDPADKMKLEGEGRPALTINMILTTVNAVLGEQAANSVEFRFVPKLDNRETTPDLMTKVVKVINDENNYEWLEQQVFSDAMIQDGRGFFDVRVDFDNSLAGEVVITAEDPTSILIDPDAKEYDPSTWHEVFKSEWLSLDQIEAAYGKKKRKEIEAIGINRQSYGVDSVLWHDAEDQFGDTRDMDETYSLYSISDKDMRNVRLVRVIERQHKRLEPCMEFVDMATGDTKEVPPTWDEERAQAFAQQHQLGILKRPKMKVRWTVTADKVLLHDDWSPYATFTKIPMFAYFRRGKPFGLVSNLISPQEQLNKLASQELHIINTTANSGWIIERNSLSGMTADDLRNQGAETGIVLEVNPGKAPPAKIEPNRVPSGIERAALKSADFIREISGVNHSQLGFDNPEVSGVALQQKEMRGQIQMQVPLDNLQYTRKLIGAKILELVQQFYTEQRIFKVATTGTNPLAMGQGEEQFIINAQTATGEILNDVSQGKYTLTLAMVPRRDSIQDQQFAEALNLRNVGVMVPDDRVVEYSHLAHKEALAEEIRQLQGRGQPSEDEIRMMQFQQEVQQQMMMIDVQRAQMEVQKLQAEIAEKMAKLDPESADYQLEKERMQLELTMAREQLELRRELAHLSNMNNLDKESMKVKGEVLKNRQQNRFYALAAREKNRTDLERENMKLKNQQMQLKQQAKGMNRNIGREY